MAKFVSEKIRKKSGARLAAVQATYMAFFGDLPIDEVIKDFKDGKIGRYVIEEKGAAQTEELVEVSPIDTVYFENLVKGVHQKKEALEKSLAFYLNEKRDFEKLDGTMQALLLCATYELTNNMDVDTKVLIQEYVDLAYAFFCKNEPKMVNALLDQIAHAVRG
ncbi:MAG: transcription antitermination factor NusB [Alphaproteobacteria bacterium]|nr:transcription antitermination factor NusB [Alphaproteobacteria bacterium]MBQ7660417.1 transcription antitermination factor NusB [Alphaproteobacteria bacterium]